jgi:hypothetical protein
MAYLAEEQLVNKLIDDREDDTCSCTTKISIIFTPFPGLSLDAELIEETWGLH